MPQQRHFHPPPDSRSSQARYLGSEQSALLEGLLARVSALESQFTCMEAVMVNIEDKLSGTPSSPSRSLSIRRPGKARTAMGKTAVVKEIGGDETVEPNRRTPRAQTNSRSRDAVMQMASSDPALAAEAAAAKLADIVGRSRLEFDAATSDALANIANMLNDIKALNSARASSG
ncbi:hypothetical protein LPJ70_002357 [Coemansia sp. RSA 2708]|nr:hypothetical protein LPJ70_002357 [Coemansia sp. RSA 2708]